VAAEGHGLMPGNQQFPLVSTDYANKSLIFSVVPSQTNCRFRSTTSTVKIGSLHKLGVPERSLAQTHQLRKPSLGALGAETPCDYRTEPSSTALSWLQSHAP
jgi:hypothetical protein